MMFYSSITFSFIRGIVLSVLFAFCFSIEHKSIILEIEKKFEEYDEEEYLFHLRDTVIDKGLQIIKEQHVKVFEELEFEVYSQRFPNIDKGGLLNLFFKEMEPVYLQFEKDANKKMDRWDDAVMSGTVIPMLSVSFSFDSLKRGFNITPRTDNRPFDLIVVDKSNKILSGIGFNDKATYQLLDSELYVLSTVLAQKPDMILKPYYHCEWYENSFTNLGNISGLILYIKNGSIFIAWRKDAELLKMRHISSSKRQKLYGDTIIMHWEDAIENDLIEGLITRYAYEENKFPLEKAHKIPYEIKSKVSAECFIDMFKREYSRWVKKNNKDGCINIPCLFNLESIESIDYIYIAPYKKRERLLDFLSPPRLRNYVSYEYFAEDEIWRGKRYGLRSSQSSSFSERLTNEDLLLINYYQNNKPDYLFYTINCPIAFWSIKDDTLYCLLQEGEKLKEYEYRYCIENKISDEVFFSSYNPFNNSYPWR